MMKFTLILVFSTVAFAQLSDLGRCSNKKPVKNIDVEALMGTWYEVGRYAGISNIESKCNKEVYTMNKDKTIDIEITKIRNSNGETVLTTGIAKMSGDRGEGEFSVVYFTKPVKTEITLLVLDTDYKTYILAYTCKQVEGRSNVISASIYTRKRVPKQEIINHALNVVDLNGLNSTLILRINQENCDN